MSSVTRTILSKVGFSSELSYGKVFPFLGFLVEMLSGRHTPGQRIIPSGKTLTDDFVASVLQLTWTSPPVCLINDNFHRTITPVNRT